MNKHYDCSPSNFHDLERIEELEKELRELKERIIDVEVTYTLDRRMYEIYSTSGLDMIERDIRCANMSQMVHDIYKGNLYVEGQMRKQLPSLTGSYEVIEFKHRIKVLRPKAVKRD